jgi:hypothetical protein
MFKAQRAWLPSPYMTPLHVTDTHAVLPTAVVVPRRRRGQLPCALPRQLLLRCTTSGLLYIMGLFELPGS